MSEKALNYEPARSSLWRRRLGSSVGAQGLRTTEAQALPLPEHASSVLDELRNGPRLPHPIFEKITPDGLRSETIAETNTLVRLPVANFISAPAFENWETGRINGIKTRDDGSAIKSAKLIGKYSRLRGDTAPPIDKVTAIMQPNGLTLYQLVGDGAHRIAAAIRREDEYINVKGGVSLYYGKKNFIPLPSQDDME